MAKQTIQVADKPTLDEIKALLENSGYGLEAIKNTIPTNVADKTTNNAIKSLLENSTYGLSTLKAYVDEVESMLKKSTYGLSALKNALGGSGAVKSVQRGKIDTGTGYISQREVTINTVNPDKCMILYYGSGTFVSLSSSKLTFNVPTSGGGITWQVIEFY